MSSTRAANVCFTAERDEIARAVRMASVVEPERLTEQPGSSGAFLFVVEEEFDGTARCAIHARGDSMATRSTFTVECVTRPGAFAFPAAHIGWFERVPQGDRIVFETADDEKGPRIKCRPTSGGTYDHPTYDHRHVQVGCLRNLDRATTLGEFPSKVLSAALRTIRPFVAGPKDEFVSNAGAGIHACGDGRLVALSGMQAAIFTSASLAHARFNLQREQLGATSAFLARSRGTISLRTSDDFSFLVNDRGDVVGWHDPHTEPPSLCDYEDSRDDIVVRASRATLLGRLQSLADAFGRKGQELQIAIDRNTLLLKSANVNHRTEIPVPVTVERAVARYSARPFVVEIQSLLKIVEYVRSEQLEFRIAVIPGQKRDYAVLRTQETLAARIHGGAQATRETAIITRYAIGCPVRDTDASSAEPKRAGPSEA